MFFHVGSIMNVYSCYPGEADRPILLPIPDHHNMCLDDFHIRTVHRDILYCSATYRHQ